MISNRIGLTARTLANGHLCPSIVDKALIFSPAFQQSFPDQFKRLSNRSLTTPAESTPECKPDSRRPLDNRLVMHRLRNNFSRQGKGLRVGKNRDNLVAEFFDLSKAVMDNQISVEELVSSQTFKDLLEQVEFHIDIMNNAQIVNLLSSLIKMRANPANSLVKLLEHEVKFRINALSLSQVMKLIKFYSSAQTSYKQRQVTDILNNRIRACVHGKDSCLGDLVDVLRHLRTQKASTSLFSAIEEKLLNVLTETTRDDDDMISRYLNQAKSTDYELLCNLFIELAANKRRPTPLLKAASHALSKKPFPKQSEVQPSVQTLIATLNALVSLSYPNRLLVSKIMNDLADTINLDEIDLNLQCALLRSILNLRWRPDRVLDKFFEHVKQNASDMKKVDFNTIATLLHVTAQVNYRPQMDLKSFYQHCMVSSRESLVDRCTRKWLNHVWSLSILDIAEGSHFDSVLNNEFIQAIANTTEDGMLNFADTMKLLNLKAIAQLEQKRNLEGLDRLSPPNIQKSAEKLKFAAKVREALNGLVSSNDALRHDVQTPYGVLIDCELLLNKNLEYVSLSGWPTFDEILSATGEQKTSADHHRCALIFVSYDDTIVNSPAETIGHRRVASRILANLGYTTIFLTESLLSREKTSADLSSKIKEIVIHTVSPSKSES